jgi:FtsZ-binding cell division protein ZapB
MIPKTCEEYVLMELAAAQAKVEQLEEENKKLEEDLAGANKMIRQLVGKLRDKEVKKETKGEED